MSTKLFGTDGIRARAGEFPLNAETITAIGQAIAERLDGDLFIGQDTRVSSPWILDLLKAGIARTTAKPIDAGVIPTPGIALLTKTNHFTGGVMISASHNPYEDNGVKVFSSDGTKLDDQAEAEIEKRVFEIVGEDAAHRKDTIPDRKVTAANTSEWPGRYIDLLSSHFPSGQWLKDFRVVMDCANGAMSEVAPTLFRRLGAEVVVVNASPTGTNINAGCGAVHLNALLTALKEATRESKADFGVAFDGDGDRSLFSSGSGRALDGDAILLMISRRLKHAGRLIPPLIIGTLMTNFALEKLLAAEGIGLKRVSVGDRFIFEAMQRGESVLGGEPSGHIIFSDFRLSGDALLTALKVAETLVEERASFDELTADWMEAPQLLKGVRVRRKIPLDTMPALNAKLAAVESELNGVGRLVVRYSGTEPLLRVMIESDDAKRNERLMNELLATIQDAFEGLA